MSDSRELEVMREQVPAELSVEQVIAQVQKVQALLRNVMKEGDHYGVIPGTDKPTLLKPGAEKICFLFRLAPQYAISRQMEQGGHVTVVSTCTLTHIPTQNFVGSGMGSCSTREAKYAYRKAERKCPKCNAEAIIKGKEQYGGGWLCWAKKGGCGTKFAAGASEIEAQEVGRVANPDLPDTENTVLKMSNKRSLIAAVLNATAVSDIFTQDLDETTERIDTSDSQVVPEQGAAHKDASRSSSSERDSAKTAGEKGGEVDEGAARPPSSADVGRKKGLPEGQREELARLIKTAGVGSDELTKLFKAFNVTALEGLTAKQAEVFTKLVQKTGERRAAAAGATQ
jgi:hypothetical protein